MDEVDYGGSNISGRLTFPLPLFEHKSHVSMASVMLTSGKSVRKRLSLTVVAELNPALSKGSLPKKNIVFETDL